MTRTLIKKQKQAETRQNNNFIKLKLEHNQVVSSSETELKK